MQTLSLFEAGLGNHAGKKAAFYAGAVGKDVYKRQIFTHTTTIGIRRSFMERTVLKRECQTIETRLGTAAVKVCKVGQKEKIYPEYESVKKIAKEQHLSFSEVCHEVKQAALRQ